MCLQGGGQRGLCVTSWRCQTPGIAVKHALAHVAICSVTRQHLGVPQTTEDEHGRQRRAVDPEAGTRAIDRPRSLLAGVCGTPRCPPCLSRIANRMARVSTVMPAVWLPRRRPRGLRHARRDTITTRRPRGSRVPPPRLSNHCAASPTAPVERLSAFHDRATTSHKSPPRHPPHAPHGLLSVHSNCPLSTLTVH